MCRHHVDIAKKRARELFILHMFKALKDTQVYDWEVGVYMLYEQPLKLLMVRWADEISQSFERHLARSSRKLKAGMSARHRDIGDGVLRSGVDNTV